MKTHSSHMMTSKGQITIPKSLREAINLYPGDQAMVSQLDERTLMIRSALDIEDIRQKIGPPTYDEPLTQSEIENIKARGL